MIRDQAAGTFPDLYRDVPLGRLLEAYREGPDRLGRVIAGLSDEERRARPIAGKWSTQEIVCHVADSELIGAARLRMVIGGDDPELPGYDQDRWARDHGYQQRDRRAVADALDLLATLRRTTLPLLERLMPADWHRAGTHPEHGSVTVRNLLELYADHTERHIAQIVERRRLLDVALPMEPLLPTRLY